MSEEYVRRACIKAGYHFVLRVNREARRSDLTELTLTDVKELSTDEKDHMKCHLKVACQKIQNLTAALKKLEHDKKEALDKVRILISSVRDSSMTVRRNLIWTSGIECYDPNKLDIALQEAVSSSETEFLVKAQLKINCRKVGLQLHGATDGNGNCFFEVVSSQLDRLSLQRKSPEILRQEIVAFINDHRKVQDPQVDQLFGAMTPKEIDEYLEKISRDGENADSVIILEMAHMLQRDVIIVVSANRASPEENVIRVVSDVSSTDDPLLLGFTPENQFYSLEPIAAQAGEFSGDEYTCKLTSEGTTPPKRIDPFLMIVKDQIKALNKACNKDTILERISFHEDENDFMQTYLKEMEEQQKGVFCRRNISGYTIQYSCERHSKPKGKKLGPGNTRANACSAFVSFRFITHAGKKAVVIRRQLQHSGHDPQDPTEQRLARISPRLLTLIENLTEQGETQAKILDSCVDWARRHGKSDTLNRKYHPKLTDVSNIMAQHREKLKNPKTGLVLDCLCTTVLRDSILHYQPLQLVEGKPLIIIYQNEDQYNKMLALGTDSGCVLYLTSISKGVTAHRHSLCALVVRGGSGQGEAVAHLIASEESSDTVALFLRVVKTTAENRGNKFEPGAFMVGRDMNEVQAVKSVFPDAQPLLCWYHVVQIFYSWFARSGYREAELRKSVIDYLKEMRNCLEKADFDALADSLGHRVADTDICDHIQTCWLPLGRVWSQFGRQFLLEHLETNSNIERFFLELKNRRQAISNCRQVEDVLLLIHLGIDNLQDYVCGLIKTGRLKSLQNLNDKEPTAPLLADTLLKTGYAKQITWVTETLCVVPARTPRSRDKKQEENSEYHVDLAKVTCECAQSMQGDICKHIHLVINVAADKGVTLEEAMRQRAELLLYTQSYSHEGPEIEVYHEDGEVSIVNTCTSSCTCRASQYGMRCVCLRAADVISKQFTVDTYTCEIEVEYEEMDYEAQPNDDMVHLTKLKLAELKAVVDAGWLEQSMNTAAKDQVCSDISKLHDLVFQTS